MTCNQTKYESLLNLSLDMMTFCEAKRKNKKKMTT